MDQSQPVGGLASNQTRCNLGKNIPNLHKVVMGQDIESQMKKSHHQKSSNFNQMFGNQVNPSKRISDISSDCPSPGLQSQNDQSITDLHNELVNKKKREIETIKQAVSQYASGMSDQ